MAYNPTTNLHVNFSGAFTAEVLMSSGGASLTKNDVLAVEPSLSLA
jgi:DICT domain-containing protein